jgi:hypothetical protein
MELQPSPLLLANRVNVTYGKLELAAAQLRLVQNIAEQQAASVVKLVESASQTRPSPQGSLGHNLDLWA